MILKQVTAEQKAQFTSIQDNYRKAKESIVNFAVLFAEYGTVYSIMAESNLYKEHKVYDISVYGNRFQFDAPKRFETDRENVLKGYGELGRALDHLYLHVVWNADTQYWAANADGSKGEKHVYVENPPNIGELFRDAFNNDMSDEMQRRMGVTRDRVSAITGQLSGLPPGKVTKIIKRVEKEMQKKMKAESKPVPDPLFEELKRSFSAKRVASLADFAKAKGISRDAYTGYIEIIGNPDDVHQPEWMLNQKLVSPAEEPLDIILPRDRTYSPFPWNRRAVKRRADGYHFRLNQSFSIIERKAHEVLLMIDEVEKNMLSVSLESDLSSFIDFLHGLRGEMRENKEKEDALIGLYFGRQTRSGVS